MKLTKQSLIDELQKKNQELENELRFIKNSNTNQFTYPYKIGDKIFIDRGINKVEFFKYYVFKYVIEKDKITVWFERNGSYVDYNIKDIQENNIVKTMEEVRKIMENRGVEKMEELKHECKCGGNCGCGGNCKCNHDKEEEKPTYTTEDGRFTFEKED